MNQGLSEKLSALFDAIAAELKVTRPAPSANGETKKNTDKAVEAKNKPSEKATEEVATEPLHPLFELEKCVEELLAQNAKLEEQRLMAVADNQNTVRRFQNEAASVRKYGGERLASEIVGPIDTFRKVLETSPDDPQIKNYLIGFEMIVSQIDQAMANAGVTVIPAKVGDDFSPELHTALEQVETDVVAPGKICAIISNGYKLHDRVIKHTTVKVAK